MSKLMKGGSRLGRGLSSLISVSDLSVERELPAPPDHPVSTPALRAAGTSTAASPPASVPQATPAPAGERVLDVPVDDIIPNPHQPRRVMNDATLAELAASLKASGIIQPIVVRRRGDKFQLIAGERRWRAAQLAGLASLPVILKDVDESAQAQMALVENIQREDLNPIDRALAYRSLMQTWGLTQAELAARLGEDRSGIANYLRILDLAESVQQMILDARLSLGHAKLLAGVPDILEQTKLANLVILQQLSVRRLEQLIKERTGAGQAPGKDARQTSPHLLDLEKNISRQLGLRVQVRSSARKKSKGRLILHYSTLDQFDDLLERLGVKSEQ